jgi:hypothetical protein
MGGFSRKNHDGISPLPGLDGGSQIGRDRAALIPFSITYVIGTGKTKPLPNIVNNPVPMTPGVKYHKYHGISLKTPYNRVVVGNPSAKIRQKVLRSARYAYPTRI